LVRYYFTEKLDAEQIKSFKTIPNCIVPN